MGLQNGPHHTAKRPASHCKTAPAAARRWPPPAPRHTEGRPGRARPQRHQAKGPAWAIGQPGQAAAKGWLDEVITDAEKLLALMPNWGQSPATGASTKQGGPHSDSSKCGPPSCRHAPVDGGGQRPAAHCQASSLLTASLIDLPSARPASCFEATPITRPMSLTDCAPVWAMMSRTAASISSAVRGCGR